MIELEVVSIRGDLPANQPLVLLKERDGARFLPIWIGPFEAESIALAQRGVEPPRPLTHDLVLLVMETLGATLRAVHVTDLREGTFFAELHLETPNGALVLSCRPSDAIALASRRQGVPILGSEEVLALAGRELEGLDDDEDDPEEEVRRFRDFLEGIEPEDFAS